MKFINPENNEGVNSYPKSNWEPLLTLIPEIEKSKNFGQMIVGETDKEGVTSFPYFMPSKVVTRFLYLVYEIPVIIDFDWPNWNEGREMLNNESFDFNTVDIHTHCKLITTLVRADRFNEGLLNSAFKSGLILKILKSIEKQLN